MWRVKGNRIVIMLLCGLLILGIISVIEAKSNEEVYQEKLINLKNDDMKGHYELGLWCLKNKLSEQAKSQFEKVLELDTNHIGAREKLGYVKYKDKWLTPDELKAQGLVQYKGKWIPYDDMMKAQGYVKFEEQWVTTKERDLLVKLNKLCPWKGVIDSPGADSENLPWEKALKKETDHFIIKTNLSNDALNDICFLLESAYFARQEFFGFPDPKEKLKVSVPKNRADFEKIHGDLLNNKTPAYDGCFIPKEDAANKLHEDHLLVHYYPDGKFGVSVDLLHEGTHGALRLIARSCKLLTCVNPPIWLDEGLATYFESGKVTGKRLLPACINAEKLAPIKTTIGNNSYIKLKEFINIAQSAFSTGYQYAEAWSLVYFLINYKEGKYKQGFQSYIEKWKGHKIDVKSDANGASVVNKDENIKIFEQCIGAPIDQLEQEWKEYILSLK